MMEMLKTEGSIVVHYIYKLFSMAWKEEHVVLDWKLCLKKCDRTQNYHKVSL